MGERSMPLYTAPCSRHGWTAGALFDRAVFDPDADTVIEPIASCIDAQHPSRFPAITAGEHIQQRIRARNGDYT